MLRREWQEACKCTVEAGGTCRSGLMQRACGHARTAGEDNVLSMAGEGVRKKGKKNQRREEKELLWRRREGGGVLVGRAEEKKMEKKR